MSSLVLLLLFALSAGEKIFAATAESGVVAWTSKLSSRNHPASGIIGGVSHRRATNMFPDGNIAVNFMPLSGGWRAVLSIRCRDGGCSALRDIALIVPLEGQEPMKIGFRWLDGHWVSTRRIACLPAGATLSFVTAEQRIVIVPKSSRVCQQQRRQK